VEKILLVSGEGLLLRDCFVPRNDAVLTIIVIAPTIGMLVPLVGMFIPVIRIHVPVFGICRNVCLLSADVNMRQR
jgi:hypothetical protein